MIKSMVLASYTKLIYAHASRTYEGVTVASTEITTAEMRARS